jgi:hypothetical protein
MLNRFCSGAKVVAQVVPLMLVLSLIGCGGGSSSTSITPPPPPPPPPVTPSISAAAFGMQCGVNPNGCPYNGTDYTWPPTQAQPGLLRLWDATVQWNVLNPSSGTYSFTNLDRWLDAVAAQWAAGNHVQVMYTFGWVPFWDAPTSPSSCQSKAPPDRGSGCPPVDLAASGSPSFNAFVTALVAHCSAAGNCVSKYIQYWELWNEPDVAVTWTGTVLQMYQMLAPIPAIIRAAIPTAEMLGPSITDNENTSVAWITSFVQNEVSSGILSNIYSFHIYLQDKTPETAITAANGGTNNGVMAQLAPNLSTSGWTPRPWWITETNFANGSQPNPYQCYSTSIGGPYSATDCTGQIVRWQLLLNSNGAVNVTWYSWLLAIGSVPQNDTAYYYMMQYMEGGTFPSPCSSTSNGGIQTWTCNFTEADGTKALFVWTPTEAGTSYTVPSGYTDYKDFSSASPTSVTGGQTITIGTMPFMLEM